MKLLGDRYVKVPWTIAVISLMATLSHLYSMDSMVLPHFRFEKLPGEPNGD